ncbi:MAG: hypothetical protein K8U03_08585 [Planctomycetia bacterium]|nr:hypothetical protein [Planctomycetia bacterium]
MSRSKRAKQSPTQPKPVRAVTDSPTPPTLAEVCAAPDDLLGKLDLAAINLMCATGLPGAEYLDYGKCSAWLDDAARRVDLEIRRHWYRFLASPKTYRESPGFFCCSMMLQVLQEDCGVRYNPERAVDPTWQDHKQEPVFRDSRDLFIHGMIDGPGGTCGSMPVLYVAVGRRLGYPLKLVEARGHLFFRWDDPLGLKRSVPERFNVDGDGHGIGVFSDEHYRTWPEPWNEAERKGNLYLRSLTQKEELAAFLGTRAACLEDNGRINEAIQAYRWACGLVPHDPRPRNTLNRMIWRLQQNVMEMNAVVALGRQTRLGQLPGMQLPEMPFSIMPSHGNGCRCLDCDEAREASRRPKGAAGHFPQCNCLQCRTIREPLVQAPWHSAGCVCTKCRQAQAKAAKRVPGHPFGCGCMTCRNAEQLRRRHGAQ